MKKLMKKKKLMKMMFLLKLANLITMLKVMQKILLRLAHRVLKVKEVIPQLVRKILKMKLLMT